MPRRTVPLVLTADECAWLTLELPADYCWPPAPQGGRRPPDEDVAGGPDDVRPFLRPGVAALTKAAASEPVTYQMDDTQLWWLHDFVMPKARAGKCPSGAPVMGLYLKVCTALIEIHAVHLDEWPVAVKETDHAPDAESHADQHAHADADTG